MPTAHFIEILAVQRPFPFMRDEHNRVMFSCNYEAQSSGLITKWEESIVKILSDAGLAVSGQDTFIGPAVSIPAGNGPYIHLLDSGGTHPRESHNGTKYEYPSIQIIVRALSYEVARTRALAIYNTLDGKRNVDVTVI